jgi:hypothetical protein
MWEQIARRGAAALIATPQQKEDYQAFDAAAKRHRK